MLAHIRNPRHLTDSSRLGPLWARVIDTFIAPRRLYGRFGERAPWLGALVLSTLVAMAVAATRPEEFYLEQMEGAVNRRGAPVEITSPPAEIVRFGRYLAALSAMAGHPLIALAFAGILTLLFTVLGGGSVGFVRYLAVVAHALLIPALGVVLVLVARWIFATPVETHAAILFPKAPDTPGHHFLRGVDFFQIWMIFVLATGVASLDPRRSRWSAAGVLLGVYLAANAATLALP